MQDTKTSKLAVRTAGEPGAASGTRRHVRGDDLVPKHDPNAAVSQREYLYWVGALPAMPLESVSIAGVCFPKINEKILPDPQRTDRKIRVPVIGSIVRLTEAKLKLIAERLPRTVVRFYEGVRDVKDEPGTGENIGDVHTRARRGNLITIPKPEDVAAAEKAGKPSRRYVPDRRDEPAARYVFMQLCANQETGNYGETYPNPLEETGIDWPELAAPTA